MEEEMKPLWLILSVIPLFAQNPNEVIRTLCEPREIIYFKKGDVLIGELISIKLNQELNPMTGFSSEVVFKPYDKLYVSQLLSGGTINNGEYYIFDAKDIDKIESELSYGTGIRTFKTRVIYTDERAYNQEYSNREEINKDMGYVKPIQDCIARKERSAAKSARYDELKRSLSKINMVCTFILLLTQIPYAL